MYRILKKGNIMTKRVLLCIMDGWGISKDSPKDATKVASTPNLDKFYKTEPNIQIFADGEHVGLPDGQMGNSEVGHLALKYRCGQNCLSGIDQD